MRIEDAIRMKKILGLDLGTNSIGWAVVTKDENTENSFSLNGIEAAGSRIIPMDAALMGDFNKGNSISQTAERTKFRSTRRLHERCLLRRERLHRVLGVMNILPEHYYYSLDRFGKFLSGKEPKLAWNKGRFLFGGSYAEMLSECAEQHPELVAEGKRIPYDWTIYYLRKKALTKAVSKEELAWILLNFNKKRGYYQLRGEDEFQSEKKQLVEYCSLKVVAVEDSGDRKGKDVWYNVHLENGWIYRRSSSQPLDWVGKIKDFIVTTDLNEDGSIKKDKEGNEKRSFRAPNENDWTLIKKKTEKSVEDSGKTVGEYIYDTLMANPNQKINGKLVRVIERKFYKRELRAIIEKQMEFIPELTDKELYKQCVEELYPSNDAYRNNIIGRDFSYLLIDDIIFYQRPLKSKKSTISDCPYEVRYDKDGVEHKIKCLAKSNPYYQEFRLWQFISNLRIIEKGNDNDVTKTLLRNDDDYASLFKWLNDKKEIKQDTLLKDFFRIGKKDVTNYRWNYVEEKSYPCNKTRAAILAKCNKSETSFLTDDIVYKIWHVLYSIKTQAEIDKTFSNANKGIYLELRDLFSDSTLQKIKGVKFEEEDYGAYSEKAIKKLLSLMRRGTYWSEEGIDAKTKERINIILDGEYDKNIRDKIREKVYDFTSVSNFQGLPVWLACYIVYNRHSEGSEIQKWDTPADIDIWLSNFKQHSLHNPIVEQVVTETMRTVRDIWKQVGTIDEIHIELGRELKNPADKRRKMTEQNIMRENTNTRIRALLTEFINPDCGISNVRPYSPMQQDLLKIYEEEVLGNHSSEMTPEIQKIFNDLSNTDVQKRPSHREVLKYKLWLDQKYQSPYTGEMIPLSKLFTPEYEIEHIIPQSRYFDDSFGNKVICESEVNKLKDNQLGFEFITNHSGQKVQLAGGKFVNIFTPEAYKEFVSKHYAYDKGKLKRLLMDDIPDEFIERQLNDSRYISSFIKGILSNIVRERDDNGILEEQSVSKNVISCSGGITDRLKKEWGVNDVWNTIILPRFTRLNDMSGTTHFTTLNSEGHIIPDMPVELKTGFNKKRIDHRHHAMDAIVIACTSRDHINLLNNEAALSKNRQNRYALSYKLRNTVIEHINGIDKKVFSSFKLPWPSFNADVKDALKDIVVSFKQNLRVINKAVNHYQHIEDGKKVMRMQTEGNNWAIRKSLHKDTVFGEVNLRFKKRVQIKKALAKYSAIVDKELKDKIIALKESGFDEKGIVKYFSENQDIWPEVSDGKVEVYYFSKETNDRYFATRFLSDLVTYFAKITKYEDAIKKIEAITDAGIQKILKAHLAAKGNNPEQAFSPDGIDDMNKKIFQLNGGKQHKPIYTVRRFEKAEKFPVGETGNKSKKFVEADKGTNLFFAVFESVSPMNEIKRAYCTLPLYLVIECQKKFKKEWKDQLETIIKNAGTIGEEYHLAFILSPNDLVYLPTTEGCVTMKITNYDKDRIYKMVSSSGNQCFFVRHTVSSPIVNKFEYTPLNKMERAITGEMIKETCVPIQVDRLGNIRIDSFRG